ncbi:alpha-amylase family glycosyl hydrolase [Mucilaginibacter sp. PAMB04274]|uniref:alpha-amylase family glycosyl hydrolase n=1 Tax=Mucilaginibacter sp. PAMB04274 TaxID=3138568 RepID=UPI0031F6124B
MKAYKLITTVLLISAGLQTAYTQVRQTPKWLDTAVFYQVYPPSFKDSNGDGIGDLKGMLQKLPYIQSLGVNVVWLNPCFESGFRDGGYDVTNFYQVAPRYGTNDDLKELCRQAHRLGIKVCFDLVAGHTSVDHPWFKSSATDTTGIYRDRYVWTNSKQIKPEKFVNGGYNRNGTYLKNYFAFQPALNYGYAHPNPAHSWEQPPTAAGPVATREELKKIMAYWMEQGADGFRVDMASSLIKNDPDFAETNKLWNGIRNWFSGRYPEGMLIAEWSNPQQAIKAGFMMDFLMHFNTKGYPSLFFDDTAVVLKGKDPFFSKAGKGNVTEFVDSYLHHQQSVGQNGFIAVPTSNHDFQRLRSGHRQDVKQLKVAMAFLLTWQSVPFIYYGDEIGMRFMSSSLPDKEGSVLPDDLNPGYRANRAGSRTPMQWSAAANAGFSAAPAQELYLPVDAAPDRPTVEAQDKDNQSLLNFVRQLIVKRKAEQALSNKGELKILYAKKNEYPLIFSRFDKNNRFLICINPADKPVNVTLPATAQTAVPVMVQDCEVTVTNKQMRVAMQGVSFGIYKLN